MKKIILSLATVLMMGISTFAAKNDDVITLQAQKSFNKEFTSAKNVQWEQSQTYVKATFTMNDQVLFAYYNNAGELTAVIRNITSSQLPINLLTELKNTYSGFWISDLFETASNDQTTYYVTLENADKKIVLESNGPNGWNVFSKMKKDIQ
ncbi:hypothetical protein ACX0G9_27930 [Flavitalea flava]